MELETLKDLYIHELKDLTAPQLTKALPKWPRLPPMKTWPMARLHLDQTEEHVNRLEQILESHKECSRPKVQRHKGLIEEGSEMIEEDAEDEVRDAGLIAAAQRVEHYEIAGYGCARAMPKALGDTKGAKLCSRRWMKSATDKKLTELAKTLINVRAQ